MPSTYTSNLGIEKPADGEQAGTWGNTVNDNSDILDRAVHGGLALTLTGTASTITTTDGSPSNGQYKLLYLQGTPSGTHTITIDPNDAQKIYYVYNTTAQSVIFTQGSGGNATVTAGDSAVLFATGAGATSAVVNITDHLAMSSVKITGGSITGITDLAIADGGTGSSTASGARTNLGLAIGTNVQAYDVNLDQISALTPADSSFIVGDGTAWVAESGVTARASLGLGTLATQNSSSVSISGGTMSGVAITGGSVSGITDLAVADGGTGASTAADARTNLGLGTIATQSAASVAITGGSVTGITDIAVADGGTGASTAAGARTNLGLAIGTDVLAYDANLQSFINLFTLPVIDGSNDFFLKTNGTGGLSFAAVPGASGGTVTSVNVSGGTTGLTFSGGPITGSGTLTMTGTLAIANGGTGATTASAARTALSVPSTTGSGASGTWGISVTGSAGSLSSTLAIASGGTGATTAATARTALDVPSTTGSGASGTWGINISGNAATATSATSATTAASATTATNVTGTVAIANGGTGATTAAAARTALGLAIGTNVQAFSSQLTTLAGLTPSDGGFIVGDGTAFTVEAPAAALLSLGINASAAELNVLDGITASTTELNYMDGVTGNVQTQLDTKAPLNAPVFTGAVSAQSGFVDTGPNTTPLNNVLVGYRAGTGVETGNPGAIRMSGDGAGNVAAVTFEVGGAERFRFASSGQLGIGGTNYGTAGQVITSNGSGAAPSWGTPIFSKEFTSADQTITSAGALTLAHGLGAAPKLVFTELVCAVGGGVGGYAAGDVLSIGLNNTTTGDNRFTGVYYDATNIYVRYDDNANVFVYANKTTGATATLTNSDWRLRVRAFA